MNSPKHILVVDDEADLVELVSYNLRKDGFIVDSASDGETALAKVRKGKYDLAILDLMLPGIQGMELCRILRNDSKTARLPNSHGRTLTDKPYDIHGIRSGLTIDFPYSPVFLL